MKYLWAVLILGLSTFSAAQQAATPPAGSTDPAVEQRFRELEDRSRATVSEKL